MATRYEKFVLSQSTPRSSKTTINSGGIHVHLYGVKELTPQQAKDTIVLFHIHGRTRTYADAEELAHQLLHEINGHGANHRGLVVATFDNRNHGTRAIDATAVHDWKGGNVRHAQDMLSTIDGIVADMETVMKFLASYVDGIFVPTQFVATGVSLGGHVAWNLLAENSDVTDAVIIVGSPNLTDMMLERLEGFYSPSPVLAGTKEWPQSIEKLYRARDDAVRTIAGKRILILNGALDPLVPTKFTRPWVAQCAARNDVSFHELQATGHWLSNEMVDQTVSWLTPLLTRTGEARM